MKILMTGGATGGHFYPIIAVTEDIREICSKEKCEYEDKRN
jgi:UDP-N-acetylglucosamine:LPS N-acetylglucosamine transferase